MISRNKFKYLLTTVSTLAIALGAATEAGAVVYVTTNAGLNQTSDGQGFTVPGIFANGDSIQLGGLSAAILINSAVNVSAIDLNTKNPTNTITASVTGATIGSIGNGSPVVPTGTMKLKVNDGVALTLSGSAGGAIVANDYSGLGAVTLGSSAPGAPGTILNITAADAVTFTNTFDTFAGTTGNWANLNISGANHIFNGKIGGNSKLGTINILAGTITFGANVTADQIVLADGANINVGNATINALLVGGANAGNPNSTLTITGASVFSQAINNMQAINVNAGVTATFNNNFTATTITLANAAEMTITKNNTIINALIDGAGTLNVNGRGVVFNNAIGNTNTLNKINIADGMIGKFTADVKATNMTLYVGSIMLVSKRAVVDAIIDGDNFDNGTINLSGNAIFSKTIGLNKNVLAINVGKRSSVTFNESVNSKNTTLGENSTAIFAKALTGAIDGPGTLVLIKQGAGAAVIGAGAALNTVRLDQWDVIGGSSVGADVKAGTLDITGGTIVKLDAHVNSTNITTGITSSDNTSQDFGDSYAIYNGVLGVDNLAIKNLGVSTNIAGTGILSASSATPPHNNKVMLDFSADGVFNLTGPGTIDNITNSTGNDNEGTFSATLPINTALIFSKAIGAAGAHIKSLNLTGTDATSLVTFTNRDIYAQEVIHDALTVDVTSAGLNINSDNYGVRDTTYNIGNQTITVEGGNVHIEGNVVIKANYVDAAHSALDLSAVNSNHINVAPNTHITLQVTGGGAPDPDTIMTVVQPPVDNPIWMVANGSLSILNSGLWKLSYTNPGQLIFNPRPAAAAVQAAESIAEAETGATAAEIALGEQDIASFGGLGLKPLSTREDGVPNYQGLSIFNPTTLSQDLSTSEGRDAFVKKIKSPRGLVAAAVKQIELAGNDLYIDLNQAGAYAIVAENQNLMASEVAQAIYNYKLSGINQSLAQQIVEVAAKNGPASSKEMGDRISNAASNSSTTALSAVSGRNSFVLATSIFDPSNLITVSASSSETYAENQGVSAGDSPYDKFGLWGSVNAGSAHQKQRNGNDGFRSTSTSLVLGVDTMTSDYNNIGFAIVNSMNHMKYKDTGNGNKADATSWVGSIYGTHQYKNNWFIRGTALLNRTHINNKERRVIVGGYGVAQSKYNLISYGGEANVGFYHKFNNDIIATPSVGVRVLHNNKISYAESGNTNQNHPDITQKAMNNYSALAGLSFAKTIFRNDISFTPEVHANFQYGINMKSPKGSFVSPLTPSQTTDFVGTKQSKLTSTYGLSITGSNDRLECGVSGDITLASKYVGYQGGIKLKVKF